jgi:hypothetical protein
LYQQHKHIDAHIETHTEHMTSTTHLQVSVKRYNVVDIHRSASSGKLLAKGEGIALDADVEHDNRGTPSLLRMYTQAPALLEPQALVTTP